MSLTYVSTATISSEPPQIAKTLVSHREIIKAALQAARRSFEHDEEFAIFPTSTKDQNAAVRAPALIYIIYIYTYI